MNRDSLDTSASLPELLVWPLIVHLGPTRFQVVATLPGKADIVMKVSSACECFDDFSKNSISSSSGQ